MARSVSPNADYPEVNEHFPDYDFERLAVPPPGYELYRFPDTTHLRNRALDIDTLKKLVNHHTWGFSLDKWIENKEKEDGKEKKTKPGKPGKPQIPRRTKEHLLQILKRISYNQDPRHRADWHHFISRDCDAGPRLLRPSYHPPLFSRRMPRGDPNWEFALPPETPQLPNPQWPTPPRDGSFSRGYQGVPSFPSQPSYMTAQQYMMTQVPTRLGQSSGHGVPASFPHSAQTGNQWGEAYRQRYLLPNPGRADNGKPRTTTQASSPPRQDTSQSAYGLLDSHSSRQAPLAQINYTRPSTTGLIIGATTLSYLRLRISEDQTQLSFDSDGELYPFRCRGPLSYDGSSDIFDCVIVAGLLTNAGTTTIDKRARRERLIVLSPPERAFIGAMSDCLNSQLSDEAVSTVKERLWNVYTQHFQLDPHSVDRSVMDTAIVWTALAKSFSQFQLCYTDHYQPCGHHGGPVNSVPYRESVANIAYQTNDDNGVDISVLLQRVFQGSTSVRCTQCDGSCSIRCPRTFEASPIRIVMQPHEQIRILNFCAPAMIVRLVKAGGEVINEQYTLIGVIFRTQNNSSVHHRVRWIDKDRGANGSRLTQIYDASQISGMVPGGIKPQEQYEIAPNSWWINGHPVLLFFEKIIHRPSEQSSTQPMVVRSSQDPNLRPGRPSNGTTGFIHQQKSNGDAPGSRTSLRLKEKRAAARANTTGTEKTEGKKILVSTAQRLTKPACQAKTSGRIEANSVGSNYVSSFANSEGPPQATQYQPPTPGSTARAPIKLHTPGYANGSPSPLLAGSLSTNDFMRSAVMPTPGPSSTPSSNPNYSNDAALVENNQANGHRSIPDIHNAMIPTFNAPVAQSIPNGNGSSSGSAGSYQASIHETARNPYPVVNRLGTAAYTRHPMNNVPGPAPESNGRTSIKQEIPAPIVILDTPPPEAPAVTGNPPAASSPQESLHLLTVDPQQLLLNPTNPVDEAGLQPAVPAEVQVIEEGNVCTVPASLEGLTQEDLEAANQSFTDFMENDDNLYSSNLELGFADSAMPPLPPPDNFFDLLGQVNGIELEQRTASNPDTTLADDEWMAQWGIIGASTSAGEPSVAEDTSTPSTGAVAARSNSLKRKRDESEQER
ncbi:hypothetical protein H112_08914 [Trichophyton rubrum D6]|uniref:Uncharacterized protein n=3 Tax=Trichophyton rubrum TaxID=5551 RepID=A0A178ERN0_TRIRU|nr:uncharacterized protein TERG_01462 [Trichophyton rubrum CBS 118892]EZF09725.1 hypothetical protein H100_08935 [Trichophyton rubrum MR850]EZF36545.1 hypothetical protein H102_08894 [Trichophyton rubrum CBS 100081]EZF47232.1 hypothetical protein H103_08917 [Trichophyton rubrum CBS 288.86]EZF57809.1 hypothetical protein H104_08866 [Trichophyton rubrum CBS 289.86]EZF79098.1 hypothetical protein H110_08917 [Trichophyton rubrum MR1448]EZF89713.1 hypothetical protein H113_08982 [Trichophyton rubr